MFKLIDKKGDNYLVLDTEDGAVDEFTYNQIINCVEKGFKIEGCEKISNGYYFEIDDSKYSGIDFRMPGIHEIGNLL